MKDSVKIVLHVFEDSQSVFFETIYSLTLKDYSVKHKFWIKSQKFANVIFENQIKSQEEFFNEVRKSNVTVVFHSLGNLNLNLLKRIKLKYPQTNVVWSFWSYEYYQLPFNLSRLYCSKYKLFLLKKWIASLYTILKETITTKEFPYHLFSRRIYNRLISKVDTFVSFLPDDFNEIYNFPNKVKYFQVSYVNWEMLKKNILYDTASKSTIIIGNSAFAHLNHEEVFPILENLKIKNEIILPLSYGNRSYKNYLMKRIGKIDNLNFRVFTEFLKPDEYYKLISNAQVYIHPSRTQNGLGNIVFYLLNGTSVYLNKSSTTYLYLNKLGLKLFSIEELKLGIKSLSKNEAEINYLCLKRLFQDDILSENWILAWRSNSNL